MFNFAEGAEQVNDPIPDSPDIIEEDLEEDDEEDEEDDEEDDDEDDEVEEPPL